MMFLFLKTTMSSTHEGINLYIHPLLDLLKSFPFLITLLRNRVKLLSFDIESSERLCFWCLFSCDENKIVSFDSEFIFDPVKWPRNQVDEDFKTIAQTFGAMNSVVRVPSIDPKYKIALLLSKQVFFFLVLFKQVFECYKPPLYTFSTLCISCF